jgi:hypothetical protein
MGLKIEEPILKWFLLLASYQGPLLLLVNKSLTVKAIKWIGTIL